MAKYIKEDEEIVKPDEQVVDMVDDPTPAEPVEPVVPAEPVEPVVPAEPVVDDDDLVVDPAVKLDGEEEEEEEEEEAVELSPEEQRKQDLMNTLSSIINNKETETKLDFHKFFVSKVKELINTSKETQ